MPGAVKRQAAASTNSAFPAKYPPAVAIVPPGFLMSDPAIKSAPTAVGSRSSINSP